MPISDSTRRKAGLTQLPRNTESEHRRSSQEAWRRLVKSAVNPDNGLGVMGSADLMTRVTPIEGQDLLSKAERELLRSNALDVDDIDPLRSLADSVRSALFPPTYNPVQLATLVQKNNSIAQCIAAMEVNVDGTGWELVRKDGEEVTEADKTAMAALESFFEQPYPGVSFTTLRRDLRRDIETTGNGYLEVIRDRGGQIVFMRHVDAKFMFVVKKDLPTVVTKTITRMGVERTVQMVTRERRFAQVIGNKVVYYKEFGGSRDVDRKTGKWLQPRQPPDGESAALDGSGEVEGSANRDFASAQEAQEKTGPVMATEIIHFTCVPDVLTPYGVPRWIAQIPSVLGSREAEEFNLDFFKHGGVPPVIIFLQGGALSQQDRTNITTYLGGKARYKQRGVIVEVVSTSGDTERAAQTRVTTERFGNQHADSMFEGYDEKCALRVRTSFRLAELFVGRTEAMNFSTAYASYMVCEAQVFKPERDEFDEIINATVMFELSEEYELRSKGLAITDVANQIQALTLASGANAINAETLVGSLNEATGLNMTPMDPEEAAALTEMMSMAAMGPQPEEGEEGEEGEGAPAAKKKPKKDDKVEVKGKLSVVKDGSTVVKVYTDSRGRIRKMDDGVLSELAEDWAAFLRGDRSFEPDSVRAMTAMVKSLNAPTRKLFNAYVGMKMVTREPVEEAETADLLAAAGELLGEGRV